MNVHVLLSLSFSLVALPLCLPLPTPQLADGSSPCQTFCCSHVLETQGKRAIIAQKRRGSNDAKVEGSASAKAAKIPKKHRGGNGARFLKVWICEEHPPESNSDPPRNGANDVVFGVQVSMNCHVSVQDSLQEAVSVLRIYMLHIFHISMYRHIRIHGEYIPVRTSCTCRHIYTYMHKYLHGKRHTS